MKPEILWIIIAIIAIFLIGILVQKSYEIFAILPVGQYVQFRTTDITTGSLAIAFSETCGGTLIAYGYETASHVTYECENDPNHISLIMENLPGHTPGTPAGDGNWKLYKSSVNTEVWLCQNDADGDGSVHRRYDSTDSDISLIDTRNTETIDSTKEKLCGTACTENWQCTGWSSCVNNQQTRTCTDLNNCGTTSGKPAESQSCAITCPTFDELMDYANKWISC